MDIAIRSLSTFLFFLVLGRGGKVAKPVLRGVGLQFEQQKSKSLDPFKFLVVKDNLSLASLFCVAEVIEEIWELATSL